MSLLCCCCSAFSFLFFLLLSSSAAGAGAGAAAGGGRREGQSSRRRLLAADAPSPSPSSSSPSDKQAEALLSLRKAIDKKGTSLESWGKDSKDPCSWFGVRCEGGNDGAVTSVELPGALLEGSLPRDKAVWAALPKLKTLDLSSNGLGGGVPSEISASAELEQLNLLGNKLTGTLPASLPASLPKLETLILARNNLTGSLPAEWGDAASRRISPRRARRRCACWT